MKPTLVTTPTSRPAYLFLAIFIAATLLLAIVQWQFCQLTNSVLVFSQGVLQLVATIILVSFWLKPARKWQLLGQFLNSFLVLLLCGLLISESYIRWQEGATVLTTKAIPVIFLGFGGLLLLSKLIVHLADERFSAIARRFTSSFFPQLSGGLAVVLLITHLTGWFWLDILAAFLTACLLGVIALFFLIDGYWNIMETKT